WLETPMFKIVARALSDKGFGRHVEGKNSYWSNKIPVKQFTSKTAWKKPAGNFKFPSSV
ncbi:unnamed protein product, partial [marine sediment metagenome]